MILTNCNCGEKVNCNCGTLSFDSYVSPSTSVLSIGNLVSSNGCVFDEYVIDWYRNGVYHLTSGKGYDADITAFHPFTGTASVPVISGTYTAVLRYVVISGVQIFTEPKPCKNWCEIVTDFPEITVNSVECGQVGAGNNAPLPAYHFRISYTSSQDYSLATRSMYYSITEGSKYFVLVFQGYTVADRLKIYHRNDLTTPLTDFIIGGEATVQYDTMPYRSNFTGQFKIIIELPDYTSGDYLLIQVLPSVLSGITTTDWRLDMRCLLGSAFSLDYNYYAGLPNPYLLNSINFVRNDTLCRFEFSIEFQNNFKTAPTSAQSNSLWFAGAVRHTPPGVPSISGKTVTVNIGNTMSVPYTNAMASLTGSNDKIAATDTINFIKNGSTFQIICTSETDYNAFKTGYNHAMNPSGAFVTGWDPDATKMQYYRFMQFMVFNSPVQCGQDGETQFPINIFISWEVLFDDGGKTITINTFTIDNEIPDGDDACANLKTAMQPFVNTINNTANLSDRNFNTKCRVRWPFAATIRPGNISYSTTAVTTAMAHSINSPHSVPDFSLLAGKWNVMTLAAVGITQWSYYTMEYGIRVSITTKRNTDGSWVKEPTENFDVFWMVNPSTGAYEPNTRTRLILRKVDGVITESYPFSYYYP